MEEYSTPKAEVTDQKDKSTRPLWLSIVIMVFFVPIVLLLPYSALITFYNSADRTFDLFLFPMVSITTAGLIGLWFMSLWGVALLVCSYLLFVVMLGLTGHQIGAVESLFGVVYILLYIYIKRSNITNQSK